MALNSKQKRKYVSWWITSVVLPLTAYFAAWLIASLLGVFFSPIDLFGTGDILFLCIILLATSIDRAVLGFLETPRTKADSQTGNYIWCVVTLPALIVYSVVYGILVVERLTSEIAIENPTPVGVFCFVSLVSIVALCGARHYYWLHEDYV